ncbi:hypothetical protein DYBT9275_01098 [Dyadobacter sp. CECT 9275]|uniref:Uncharacterized protein n=1 Tax=Dyadobacter helix TaxID=2822344 RepID=A0A916J8B6_9BACT|nr:hypothetical protein [Dyadobacter sp. CECT 9275]CAG4993077.1 hypothetical protein DYBT9275_01098 [Dyadobacter sp. CECT 9275]
MATEEEKAGDFTAKISSLWKEQKIRELLYLKALKKDGMGPLRRMLSQGHFSAVLFQREIGWIYDYFKCFLTDQDLGANETDSENSLVLNDFDSLNGQEQVAGFLKRKEEAVLNSYRSVYNRLEFDTETGRVLKEHLDRITEFCEILSKQEDRSGRVWKMKVSA